MPCRAWPACRRGESLAELTRLARELRQDPDYGPLMLDDIEMLGVDALADSAVTCRPAPQGLRFQQVVRAETGDLLTVYAEAFERDANPGDFSLAAIVAHERGHQLLARHPRLTWLMNDVSWEAEHPCSAP